MDLMHFTTEEIISAVIIAFDFEKALDTLDSSVSVFGKV